MKQGPPENGGQLGRAQDSTMKRMIGAALLALALAGCNTVDGVGRDISGAATRIGGWF